MGTSFEEILKRMRNAPHAGVPRVTNPKLPTKVERDVEAVKVRRKAMPNFHFGTGTQLEQLVEHMKNAPHHTPNYGDPAFNTNPQKPSKEELDIWDAQFQSYVTKLNARRRKKNLTTEKEILTNTQPTVDKP